MKEAEASEGIIIFSKGLNGEKTYSAYTENDRKPIVTNLGIEKFSDEIIRIYPNISQKVLKFYQEIYSGDLPKDFNVSQLDPSPKIELIEKISLKLLKTV